jgi:hypothetical protein
MKIKKLNLKKEIVANLSDTESNQMRGGDWTWSVSLMQCDGNPSCCAGMTYGGDLSISDYSNDGCGSVAASANCATKTCAATLYCPDPNWSIESCPNLDW